MNVAFMIVFFSNSRCYGFPKLYCGFDQSKALYKTDGPYLLSATLHVPNAANLRVHENVPIQISVTYAGLPNTTLGKPIEHGLFISVGEIGPMQLGISECTVKNLQAYQS